MPSCRRCRIVRPVVDGWPRSPRNGRLKRVCADCDAAVQKRREANTAARATGYADRTHTPEYKRMQRERAAAEAGRSLCDYVPQVEREGQAAERLARARADAGADRIRRRYVASMLKELNRIALAFPEVDAELRGRHAAYSRSHYRKTLARSRSKTAMYKAAHVERVEGYHRNRRERIETTDDGTISVTAIKKLKARAAHCAYCNAPLSGAIEKQTDHMIPLCRGGEHSQRNVVIVCRSCNARKASLSYAEWIERIEPEHRARVERIYAERWRPLAA